MNEKSSQEDFEAGLAAANIGDFVLAFQKWMPLAQEGLAKAQCNIGTMFGAGNGVDQDFDEALKWYNLAADQGHVGGQTNLGALYANGQGRSFSMVNLEGISVSYLEVVVPPHGGWFPKTASVNTPTSTITVAYLWTP